MDNKIVVKFQPFDYQQQVVIFRSGNKEELFQTPLKQLATSIVTAAEKYGIYTVRLTGSKSFSQKFEQEIKDKEVEKYQVNKIV